MAPPYFAVAEHKKKDFQFFLTNSADGVATLE